MLGLSRRALYRRLERLDLSSTICPPPRSRADRSVAQPRRRVGCPSCHARRLPLQPGAICAVPFGSSRRHGLRWPAVDFLDRLSVPSCPSAYDPMSFEPVIGLEIHAQLLTETKIFCGCSTRFGAPPNTHVCPVCLGLPGALPVLNRRAVELGDARGARARLHRPARRRSSRARTTSIRTCPRATRSRSTSGRSPRPGRVDYESGGGAARVGITRVHLEEDAGKSLHEGFADSDARTYLDFNRSGVPLIEIVTEPDLRSAADASDFFSRLRADPRRHRRQRRQHGGGQPALRRQRVGAAGGQRRRSA